MILNDFRKFLLSSIALLIIVTTTPAFAQITNDPTGEFQVISSIETPVEVLGIQGTAGNVLAGTGGGVVTEWTPLGAFVQNWDTTSGSNEQTGMCFDEFGNVRATSWTAGTVTLFDDSANILTHPWGGPYSIHPESCVVNAAGDVYTSEVDGDNDIRKWTAAGAPIATFNVATEDRGADWMDLHSDQCTMYYTSEGTRVLRYDVCTDTQLTDLNVGNPLPRPCYALRILPDDGAIVACQSSVFRLNPDGSTALAYPAAGFIPAANSLFALNLDPDGTSFWTGQFSPGNIYRIDIATGNQLGFFNVPIVASLAGLAVFGEITEATCPPGEVGVPPDCRPIDVVGGEFIRVDSTAIVLAGIQSNAMWMLPILAVTAGTVAYYIKIRTNKE